MPSAVGRDGRAKHLTVTDSSENRNLGQIPSEYKEGRAAARLAALLQVLVGFVEIGVGFITGSLALTADGIDSFSDATISLIVWFGLRVSFRKPTKYFQYGYFKVESLVAFCTSIGMIVIASFIMYRAYLTLLKPHHLNYPSYAIIALVFAGFASLYNALRMRHAAKEGELVSLKLGAANSLKDTSGSFLVLGSVLLASLGFVWMDSVGAIIISAYIYSVAYVAARQSSLVLLDSFNSPDVIENVRSTLKSVPSVRDVIEIKLRRNGPFLSGRAKISVDGDLSVLEANKISQNIELVMANEIGPLRDFVILVVPHESTT